MRIGVYGVGVIGSAISSGFEFFGHRVEKHDLKLQSSVDELLDCEAIFICLPTPPNNEGGCDVSIVEGAVKELSEKEFSGVVVIKSTVEPGFYRRRMEDSNNLRLVSCPEFLRERSAKRDFIGHGVCVIGAANKVDFDLVRQIHLDFTDAFFECTPEEAEVIKYFHNSFNALRIAFANQFFDLCDYLNISYETVLEGVVTRNDYSKSYLRVSSEMRGFGGPCLPKDTLALANFFENQLGQNENIFKAIMKINERLEITVPDGMRS